MALSVVNKITAQSAVAASSYSTGSFTPTANKPQIASVHSRIGSGAPNTPTLSGNGLTWTQIATVIHDDSGSQKRVTAFRAVGASPSAGALTADFGGQSQSDCTIVVDEVTNADYGGTNAANMVVQAVTNQEKTGTATSLSATLAAFGNANNGTYAVCAIGNTGTFTPGSGFSTVGSVATAANITLATEFKNTNDTGVDFSFSVAGELGIIAIELKHKVDVSISSSVQSATFSTQAPTITARRKMPTLTDNFNDNSLDTAVFGSFGTTVAETNQELQLQMATSYGSYLGVFTLNRYDLASSACIVKLTSAGDQSLTSNQALFQLEFDFDNQVYFLVEQNLLKAVKKVAGSVTDVTGSIAYSSTNHKYLKISESGGTLTWWYSADGQAWTSFCTLANPFAVTGLQVNLLGGTYSVEASPSTIIWDDLNYLHPTIASTVQSATFSQPAPTVTAKRNVTVSASVQSATFSTQAPTITANRSVSVSATVQTATLSTQAPTVTAIKNASYSATVQSLTASTQAPTVSTTRSVTVSASVQAATLSTQAPTITANRSVTVSASVQSATLSTQAPTITANRSVSISANVLSVTFSQPGISVTANRSVSVSASVQTATFSTQAPTVGSAGNVTVNATVQALTATQPSPTVTAIRNVSTSVNAQSASFSQQAPSVVAIKNVSIAPNAQSLSFSQPAPTISAARNVSVAVGVNSASFAIQVPTVRGGATFGVNVLTMTLSQPLPTYPSGDHVTTHPGVLALQFSIQAPTIRTNEWAIPQGGDWATQQTPSIGTVSEPSFGTQNSGDWAIDNTNNWGA